MTKHPLAVRAELVRTYAGAVRRVFPPGGGDGAAAQAVRLLLALADETAKLADSMAQRDELADVIRKIDRELGQPTMRLVKGGKK